MKDCLIDYVSVAQVFYDNALEKIRCDLGVPDSFGINDNNRTTRTHAKAWSLATLHAIGTEKKSFALKK